MGCGGSTSSSTMKGDSSLNLHSIRSGSGSSSSVGHPLGDRGASPTTHHHNHQNLPPTTSSGDKHHHDPQEGHHQDTMSPTPPTPIIQHSGTHANGTVVVNIEDIHPHHYPKDAAGHMPLAHIPQPPHHHQHTTSKPGGMLMFKSILTEEERRQAAVHHHKQPPSTKGDEDQISSGSTHSKFDVAGPLGRPVDTSFVPLGSTPLISDINGDSHDVVDSCVAHFISSPITSFPNVGGGLAASPSARATTVTFGFPTVATPVASSSDRFPPVLQATTPPYPHYRANTPIDHHQHPHPPLSELTRRTTLTVVPSHYNNTFIPQVQHVVHIAGCVDLLSTPETMITSSGSTLLSSAAPITSFPHQNNDDS